MAHPIYTMAAVTSVVMLAVWGTILWQIRPRDDRFRWIVVLLTIGCCASPIAFFVVRRPLLIEPLDPILSQPEWNSGNRSIVRDLVKLSFAPLTEEPAKLAPWVLLLVVGAPLLPTRRMVAPLALAAGLGFALGEVWLLAILIAIENSPKLAALPWYQLSGFLSERLMTGMAHSLFAFSTIYLSRKGWKWGLAGLAIGMLLHGVSNSPITLMHRRAFGWSSEVWGVVIQIWVAGFALAGLLVLMGYSMGAKFIRRAWAGRMICPECGEIYRQSLILGLNCGMSRYERCGACHKWHWVTPANLAPSRPKRHQHQDSQAPQT